MRTYKATARIEKTYSISAENAKEAERKLAEMTRRDAQAIGAEFIDQDEIVDQAEDCAACRGTGASPDDPDTDCSRCHGSGEEP